MKIHTKKPYIIQASFCCDKLMAAYLSKIIRYGMKNPIHKRQRELLVVSTIYCMVYEMKYCPFCGEKIEYINK